MSEQTFRLRYDSAAYSTYDPQAENLTGCIGISKDDEVEIVKRDHVFRKVLIKVKGRDAYAWVKHYDLADADGEPATL